MKTLAASSQVVQGDEALANLLEEITQAIEAGGPIDVAAYEARYPQFADRIRRLIPALHVLDNLGLSAVRSSISQQSARTASGSFEGTLGDFRILREIGRGGMGIVYEAEQISLGRRMALKVLPFAGVLDERQLTRFRNEARAAGSLKHPHIVGVHSVGCERGVHYYAMEFIEGRSLAEIIAEMRRANEGVPAVAWGASVPVPGSVPRPNGDESPAALAERAPPPCSSPGIVPQPSPNSRVLETGQLPSLSHPSDTKRDLQGAIDTRSSIGSQRFIKQVAKWGLDAAEGLEHAHQMGIVHRDIKPSNLLVDSSGHLWITDFGLAQVQTDSGVTMTGDIVGTLRYMSPEQAQGNRRVLDHRSDIYSLGSTLYELLALRPPFLNDDRHVLIHQIVDGNPPPLHQLNRSIPRDLETIVLKALSVDPQARYGTAQQMADDLRRFLADEPILARRPRVAERMAKWLRRHWPVVWSAVTSLVFGIVGLSIGIVLIAEAWNREKTQRSLADEQRRVAQQQEALAKKQMELAERQRDEVEQNLYVARMRLAGPDWESGQVERLHCMLDDCVPEPGRPDLRGWEWYYYLSLCHQEQLTLQGHAVAWSPKGDRLATGCPQRVLKIWDAVTGQEALTIRDHESGINAVAWSPQGDRLATGTAEGIMRVWDPLTGKLLASFRGFPKAVLSLAWSPNGQMLAGAATTDWDVPPTTLRVWNVQTGQEVAELSGKGNFPVTWSPDGKRFACCSSGGGAAFTIRDVATGNPILSCDPQDNCLFALAFSPDGRFLAAGLHASAAVQVWDSRTGKQLVAMRHRATVSAVAWSPDGQKLATGSSDQRLIVWNSSTGQQLFELKGHRAALSYSVSWSPDGKRLATASWDRTTRVWEVPPKTMPRTFARTGRKQVAVPDRLAAAQGGAKYGAWGLSVGQDMETAPKPPRIREQSPDGKRMVRTGRDPQGTYLFVSDIATGKELFRLTRKDQHRTAWSPDSTRIAIDAPDDSGMSRTTVYRVADGQVVASWLAHPVKFMQSMAWSPDGTRLATGGDTGHILVRDVVHNNTVFCVRTNGHVFRLAWSLDGSRLASGAADHRTVIWDATDGRQLQLLEGHTGDIRDLGWAPDGKRIASASSDQTVKVWDTATGQELLSLPGSVLAWSRDGHRLATIDAPDETLRIYDATVGYRLAETKRPDTLDQAMP